MAHADNKTFGRISSFSARRHPAARSHRVELPGTLLHACEPRCSGSAFAGLVRVQRLHASLFA